jgi:DNA-binding CsgD family transcriptional regulator
MDSIVELLACADEHALSRRLDSLLERFGVSRWVYALDLPVHGGSREQYSTGAYPEAWVERYLAEGYLGVDPIVGHCAASVLPILWDDAARICERTQTLRSRRARQMFREADALGMGAGLSVPLHGPGQTWGLISFAAEARVKDELRAKTAELHMLATYAHEAGRRFAPGIGDESARPELTRRERECLQWAAEGKTSWEIGRLLRISERTVVFHLNNASQKLGVCGRQAAIARGVSLGLVSIR